MAARIKGNNLITWGAGGTGSIGKIQSASHKLGGDKVELDDENGECFCTIYFNDKGECEFKAIFQTGIALPARGDSINIAGVTGAFVDDIEKEWANKNAMMFTIRATKYANF